MNIRCRNAVGRTVFLEYHLFQRQGSDMIGVKGYLTGTEPYRPEPCPFVTAIKLSLKIQLLVLCIDRILLIKGHGFRIEISVLKYKLIIYVIYLVILVCDRHCPVRDSDLLHVCRYRIVEIYPVVFKIIVNKLLTILCGIVGLSIFGQGVIIGIDHRIYTIFYIA